jgi:hypothetical protein
VRSAFVRFPCALGESRDLRLQLAVRLLPDPLDRLQLPVHALERHLERLDVPGEPGLRELEEAGAVRVERLRRERFHRCLEARVGRLALDAQLGLRRSQGALELDHLVNAPATLEERRPHREEDAERPD